MGASPSQVFQSRLSGDKPDGLPTFADGLRAAVLTEAVVTAATEENWVEVPA